MLDPRINSLTIVKFVGIRLAKVGVAFLPVGKSTKTNRRN